MMGVLCMVHALWFVCHGSCCGLVKAVFTLDICFCICINVTVKFNIVSMETQTQMHRMGLNPFSASMLT